jgi:hypothetical protein
MIRLWRSRSIGRRCWRIGCSRGYLGGISRVWSKSGRCRGKPGSRVVAMLRGVGPGSGPREPAPATSWSSSTGWATLVHLRHDLPHSVLGLLFGVDRSTITRAIAEIRTLLAERGCAVPARPGLRLRTMADVFAYAQAEGIEPRLDATETIRPPQAAQLEAGSGRAAPAADSRRRRARPARRRGPPCGRTPRPSNR